MKILVGISNMRAPLKQVKNKNTVPESKQSPEEKRDRKIWYWWSFELSSI